MIKKTIKLFLLFGLLGLFLRVIDLLYVRGLDFGLDIGANKENYIGNGSGVLTFLALFFSYFLVFIPSLIAIKRICGLKNRFDYLLVVPSFLFVFLEMFTLGYRYPFFFMILILLVTIFFFKRINLKILIFYSTLIFCLVLLLSFLFYIRSIALGINPYESMSSSAYSFFIPLKYSFLEGTENNLLNFIFFALVSTSQYLLHGFFELLYVLENYESIDITFGAYSLNVPLKVLYVLINPQGSFETFVFGGMIRESVYTTILGPFVYDFGIYLSLVFSYLFGVLTAYIIISRVSPGKFFLLLIFAAFFPFSFYVNFYVFQAGQYLIIASLFLLIISRIKFFYFLNFFRVIT